MQVLHGSIAKPAKLISAGIFQAQEDGWKHSARTIDSFEVIVGISGTLHIAEGDERYPVRESGCLVLYPSLPHFGYSACLKGTSFFWAHFVFHDNFRIMRSLGEVPKISMFYSNRHTGTLGKVAILPKYFQHLESERIPVLFRELLHIHESSYYTDMAADLCLTSLLVEITQEYLDNSNSRNNKTDTILAHILQSIKLHYQSKCKARDIALDLGYNPDYLARVFRRKMGMKISDYITQCRIVKAKRILLETSNPLKEIAFEVGYEDEKYFMKEFKQLEGLTPTEFRRTWYQVHYNIR
jgi:AraC-like DNA-binding protein